MIIHRACTWIKYTVMDTCNWTNIIIYAIHMQSKDISSPLQTHPPELSNPFLKSMFCFKQSWYVQHYVLLKYCIKVHEVLQYHLADPRYSLHCSYIYIAYNTLYDYHRKFLRVSCPFTISPLRTSHTIFNIWFRENKEPNLQYKTMVIMSDRYYPSVYLYRSFSGI